MKRCLAWPISSVLVGVILCGALACSGPGATKMAFDNDDSGRTVTVAVGDELDITLGSIGNQGAPSVSSPAIRLDWSSAVGAANPGGPTMFYRFTAVSSGHATITVPFQNPANPPPFTLDVDVE